MNMFSKLSSLVRNAAFILLQFFIIPSFAQITWPANQLLPSFSAPAQNQDFIYINGTTPLIEKTWRWEAEGGSIGHNTGRLETDGWLCQTGIDAANQHMVYGPYDNTVTAGPNTAEFRMKIDNNTVNNDPIVDIDVRDATTGAVLASKTVNRQDFTVASNYTSFKLPFDMPADNHNIELRVFWRGASYTKVDFVGVQQNNTTPENYLFASLKGIVNMTQPRIFSYEGDAFAEGPFTWLQSLGLNWTEHPDRWDLITKYRSEISGLIVYDPAQNHTVNLATTLAKGKKALVASPSLVARLTSAPYNLPILIDLRGKYNSKLAVYQDLFNNYWPSIDHRLLIGISPDAHQAAVREYAAALGAAAIWLDPTITAESDLLNKFLSSMPANACFMGWWPEEGAGVTRASQYGIATVASDYACNLTMHGGMPRTINAKPMPPKPTLQNKIYVAFILSDGDNLQYVEHLMRKLWNNPDRGSVPMGWTLSPAMVDAMPGALNFYHQTSTTNDNLISGPSGYGYAYPNDFPNATTLNQYVTKTEEYNRKAGLRVITVWNTITGGINANVGQSFAANAPTLLGLTAQDTGGPLTIYNGTLPGKPLSCNYCSSEQYMKDFIAGAASGWNGTQPRFIIIQAQPWTDIKPTNFKNVANSLNSDYIVVRPDHLFQLMREANGLTVNPGAVNGAGDGLTAEYYNGMNFETPVTTKKDANLNLDWGNGSPAAGVNADQFTARWTGKIQPRYSGEYTFYINSDNGRRVWINDQLIIDKWVDDWGTEYSGKITLNAGQKYNIRVEYFENNGGANIKLEWASPFQSREIIPTAQLYSNQLPTVSITSPTNNATFVAAAAITLNATAADADGSIAKVEFYSGTTLLGSDNTSPFSFNWTGVAPGTYTITAKAIDNIGAVTTSSAITVKVNANQNPTVTITSPANGATYTAPGVVNISATATDADGTIAKVEFYNGATLLSTVTATPYTYSWTNVPSGNYSITAKATDDKGGVTTSSIVTIVVNAAPTISITAPANNATFVASATITLTASAADADGSIAKVEFYNGTTLLGTKAATPFTYNWTNVGVGTYSITAKAYDNLGLTTTSTAITVKVNANQNPTVNVTAVSSSPNTISITANATDGDGTITKVDYYDGATKIGTSTSNPYNFNYTGVSAGSHSITAVATDDKGGTTTSTAVVVNVSNANQPPTVSITSPANNATYVATASITITATATDDGSIAKVEFYNGTSLLGTSTTNPYSYSWTNVTAGTYSITAKAYDNLGLTTASSAITVKVNANQNPTVNVTAVSSSPNTISITANATDGDGTITKVDYYDGAIKIGTSTSNPYTFNYTGVSAGSHSITAVATDDKGGTTTSTAVVVNVSNANQAPTVSITLPANNATYVATASISFTATATDDGSIAKVEFYNGTSLLGTSTTNPYSYSWTNVTAGTYSITAKAYDNLGLTTTSTAITVKVNANQSPVVSVNATPIGPNTVAISATATDGDGTITTVEFFDGTTKIGESSSSPYTFNWTSAPAGSHSLTAIATDDKGGKTTSNPIVINVTNTNQSPTVVITSPVNNQNFSSPTTIEITVNANDVDGNVIRVEYYNGLIKIGESTSSPFTYNFNAVDPGDYYITAIAYDNNGFSGNSSVVQLSVENATAVLDEASELGITIYPNPTLNVINFNKEVNSIKIVDMMGNVLEYSQNTTMNIDLSKYSEGTYTIIAQHKEKAFVQRIVKCK